MKKFLTFLLALTLLISCAQAADLTDCAIANGTVQAVSYVDITAPFSGTLEPFDLAMGDAVSADDPLFSLLTTTVYAPEDGTVEALFGQPGDDAAALCARYGAVAALEPAQMLRISASTAGAYDEEENRIIHVGETLYFRSTQGDKEEGSGQVIMVMGKDYVVDITEGEFELNESLTLYRDDRYGQKDKVGKGVVTRRDPVQVQGQGRIAQVFAEAGSKVKAGDPLFSLMTVDADASASPTVSAPANGVIGSVAVAAGQQVWKGQVLARVLLTDKLEVVADVDEIDLNGLRVGDMISVTLDVNPDMVIAGTVTEISALGVTRQNAAYFTVHVSIPAGNVMLGSSASVYLPR